MQSIPAPSSPTERVINPPALIETCLLGAAAAMLLTKAAHGVLIFYIHPRYTPLIIACALLLLLVAAIRATTMLTFTPESLQGRRGHYLLLTIPFLLGTLVPARPLGANALSSTTDISTVLGANVPTDDDTSTWNLLQWATALSVRGEQLNGKAVDVVGFVYHDPARPIAGFFVVRYVIICCTADSNGVHLPVVWNGSVELKADSWVRVRGRLGTTMIENKTVPALIATLVEPTEQPASPYLYP
jgi:putative membrane protein